MSAARTQDMQAITDQIQTRKLSEIVVPNDQNFEEVDLTQADPNNQTDVEPTTTTGARNFGPPGEGTVQNFPDKVKKNIQLQRNKASKAITKIPIPGDIKVPLILLLLLFAIIIPVNGHQRIIWFWLALVGQAFIGNGSGTITSQNAQQIIAGSGIGVQVPNTPSNGSGSTTGNQTVLPSPNKPQPQGPQPLGTINGTTLTSGTIIQGPSGNASNNNYALLLSMGGGFE